MCKLNADHSVPGEQEDKQQDAQHVNLIKSKPTERVERLAMKIGGQCWSRRLLVIILIELIALCQTVGFLFRFLSRELRELFVLLLQRAPVGLTLAD